MKPFEYCPLALKIGLGSVLHGHDELGAWHYTLMYEESLQDNRPRSLSLHLKLINDQLMGIMQVCGFYYKNGSQVKLKETNWNNFLLEHHINTYFHWLVHFKREIYNVAASGWYEADRKAGRIVWFGRTTKKRNFWQRNRIPKQVFILEHNCNSSWDHRVQTELFWNFKTVSV